MPTIELTDGTTTYDLMDRGGFAVRNNTFNVGNPGKAQAASLDYLGDAFNLTSNRFTIRTISMTLDIRGATKQAVVTRSRQINRLLQEARDYAIDQVGARWRLKFEMDGREIFFNIKDGMLALPPAGMSFLARSGNTAFLAAALSLACDPLGEGAEQSFGPWNRTNAMGSNFVDITPNPSGDYPAKLQLRMAENEAHTALWAGARHWPRQTDTPLDLEAEAFSGWDSTPNVSGRSGGEVGRQTFPPVAGADQPFVDATGGYDSSPSAGDTYTTPTVTASHTNAQILVFCFKSGFVPTLNWVDDGGNETPLRLAGSTANRHLLVIDNPQPGNTIKVTLGGGTLTWVAVLYQGLNIDLSARNLVRLSDGSNYTQAAADNTILVFYWAGNIANNVSLNGGTERERVNSTFDALLSEIIATSSSTQIDHANISSTFSSFVTHLVIAPSVLAAIEEQATEVVNSPKFGQFHALAWVKGESDSAYSLYLSTEYGGVERGPAGTFQHARIEQAEAGDWVVRDIGALSVPHGGLPDGANLGPLTLKLNGVATTPGLSADVDLDWDRVLLLPVEGGSAYVEKPSATDHVVLDTLSDAPGAYLWASASVFKGQPKYRGGAIYVHPKGTRIYLASDRSGDARPADGWTVTAKVVPRYLMI